MSLEDMDGDIRDDFAELQNDPEYLRELLEIERGEVRILEEKLFKSEEKYIVQRDGLRDAMQHIKSIEAKLAEALNIISSVRGQIQCDPCMGGNHHYRLTQDAVQRIRQELDEYLNEQ